MDQHRTKRTKRRGRHREKELTATQVRKVTKPGRYPDGGTLYLDVSATGGRAWVQRLVIAGARVDLGLGSALLVTLAEARETARVNRALARGGKDPRELRRKAGAVPTFKVAAGAVHAASLPTWRNERHGVEWLRSLTDYAFPTIGDRPVDSIENRDVIALLAPIWIDKAETARRVLQRTKAILDSAHAQGHRATGLDPVAIRKGLPKQRAAVVHLESLPYAEVPGFVEALRDANVALSVRLAFELLILTAARTSEVLLAEPAEFDLREKIWTVPSARMKANRAHRVPLSPRAIEIVTLARELGGEQYLFPGRSNGRPLSGMALLMASRRLKLAGTPHGFRSSFRTWASEATNIPNIVCEMALAHTIEDKVEAAYRRGDLLGKRVKLMNLWERYVLSGSAEIVPLNRKA